MSYKKDAKLRDVVEEVLGEVLGWIEERTQDSLDIEESKEKYGELGEIDWDELDDGDDEMDVLPYHAFAFIELALGRYSLIGDMSDSDENKFEDAISLIDAYNSSY